MIHRIIRSYILMTIWLSSSAFPSQPISIIPKPLTTNTKPGNFILDENVVIVSNETAHDSTADYLLAAIKNQTSLALPKKAKKPWFKKTILLTSDNADTALGKEGYELIVDKKNITIIAPESAGLFYGVQSLLQLIPLRSDHYAIPCVSIKDRPRFPWRGLHLDVSRHFFGPEFIKKYIDLLAMHKMNVFHWHLVDAPGWRLEIKKYPKLTDIGAWRTNEDGRNWNYPNMRFPGKDSEEELYGGYYTQEQIRDIVAYAQERHITIVPEIEMPGHSWAALLAYPELTCTQTQPDPDKQHRQDVYCAGKENTFRFLQDILDETLSLFPSEFIHIGGDEVSKIFWSQCEDCKHRMEAEGLKDTHELQSYFIKRIEKYLNAKGRRLIGWDEILEGGLAPNATVMSWRGMSGGITAAKAGHDVVMTPTRPIYFDASQDDPRYEPKTIGYTPNTFKMVYSFEPVPESLTGQEARHILGAQGQAWTEWMFTSDRVEYMVYPRACALAEVVWSAPKQRNWEDFQKRMEAHYLQLNQKNVNYRRPTLTGFEERNLFLKEHTVTIEKPVSDMTVRYTLDGTDPAEDSIVYEGPFVIRQNCHIKAAGWFSNGTRSRVLSGLFEQAELHEPIKKDNLMPGLRCRYYEGQFHSVKALDNNTLQKAMTTKNFAFPQDIQKNHFGLTYDGFIRVPKDGIYTFYTTSDDGSQLWIHEQLVVENDGLHGQTERSGQIGLKQGLHPIQVRFIEFDGDEHLSVFYAGPNISKNQIPANILFTDLRNQSFEESQRPMVNYLQKETKREFDQRMAWWRQARFGMFIHWGLYAIPAGEWDGKKDYGEWILTSAQIPVEQYKQFAPQFNPVEFDAAEWVHMAKEAGMKYLVITSKHHDGFCLFDSAATKYDVTNATPFQRDILKELTAECKKQGIQMCFYYSIMDWQHPDYLPRRGWEDRSPEGADFQRYIRYMKAQLKELVEKYDPAIIWFDGEWEETWNHEEGVKLYNYVRNLKPDIIINNRVDAGRGGMGGFHDTRNYAGDFGTPEQHIPASGIPGYDWESCMTMNRHWGWNKHDKEFKSAPDLIRKLIDIASKGGNFLLNVGPMENGAFPQESIQRLKEIGRWMAVHSESIYGTTTSIFSPLPWGRSTTKGNTLYLHVFDWPSDNRLFVPGLISKVQKVYLQETPSSELSIQYTHNGAYIDLPSTPTDPIAAVIVLDFHETPEIVLSPEIQGTEEFYPSTEVTIRCGAQQVQMRYTTDGSEPSGESAEYTKPLILDKTTTIKCRVYRDNLPITPVAKKTFEKLHPRNPEENIKLNPGLQYSVFQGEWEVIPDFSTLTPKTTGIVDTFDLGIKPQPEFFAVLYKGFIRIKRDGRYEFHLDSDDGSRLSIGEDLIVDNDGLHAPQMKTGVVALKEGVHSIRVDYFQRSGGSMLDVRYIDPDGTIKDIPANLLFHKPSAEKE